MKSSCCYMILFACSLFSGNLFAQSASRVPVESTPAQPIIQEANPSEMAPKQMPATPMDMPTSPAEMSNAPATTNNQTANSSCNCNSATSMSYSMDQGCSSCGTSYGFSGGYHSFESGYWSDYTGGCGCSSNFSGFWSHRTTRVRRFGGWRFGGISQGCGCGY